MVNRGQPRLESKALFTVECGRRSGSRGGKYVLHPLPLVLEGSADKTHIKNQFMH